MAPKSAECMAIPNLEVNGNTLTASEDLYWESLPYLRRACERLLSSSHECIIIDFYDLNFIFSSCLNYLGTFFSRAIRDNKRIVLRVSPSLQWYFEMTGYGWLTKFHGSDTRPFKGKESR